MRYNIPEAMEFVGILGMSMWLTAFLFTPENKHLVCYQDENVLRLRSTNRHSTDNKTQKSQNVIRSQCLK